eukprot:8771838-Karenia_brevis.AAC.1
MALPDIAFLGIGPSGSKDGIIVGVGFSHVHNNSFLFLLALWDGDLLMEVRSCLSMQDCIL